MKKSIVFLLALCCVVLSSCAFVTNTLPQENIPQKPEPQIVQETSKDVENKTQSTDVDKTQEVVEMTEITLYFSDTDAMYLHPEKRTVPYVEGGMEEVVLRELFKGPKSQDLMPTLEGEYPVISIKTQNSTCIIDFKEEFVYLNTGGTTKETFAVCSIATSLCELDGIENVKLNIEGDTKSEFGGHFTLEDVFGPGGDIVKYE